MRVVCVADLHGHLIDPLPEGDLLIIAGDSSLLSATTQQQKWFQGDFARWLERQGRRFTDIVGIAGNHDFALTRGRLGSSLPWHYLCDAGIELDGKRIWGTPWAPFDLPINVSGEPMTLEDSVRLIPSDTQILITHQPPFGYGDALEPDRFHDLLHVGSYELVERMLELPDIELVVFGHIHDGYGQGELPSGARWVNASHVDERYWAVNPPILVELD